MSDVDDWQNLAGEYWATALEQIDGIDKRQLSIVSAGPVIERALTNMVVYAEYTDEFWSGLIEWCFANIAPHIVTQGPEFLAWKRLSRCITDLMPQDLRDRPRG